MDVSIASTTLYKFLHDFVQFNVASPPLTHEVNVQCIYKAFFFNFIYFSGFIFMQKTEWTFDPETGKQRRIQYEQENGRFGKYAIAKLGMGIGYKGPWGISVKN